MGRNHPRWHDRRREDRELFCLIACVSDEGYPKNIAECQTRRLDVPGHAVREVVDTVRVLQEKREKILLIAANFQKGGDGSP
ncbi:hypothetical protein [Candidatus Flexifilum breve]|uniref:hypothetical protein n=1 Tax=Candidatus Flexifilum breve TaxID=3140694 RepID=UPI0031CC7BFB